MARELDNMTLVSPERLEDLTPQDPDVVVFRETHDDFPITDAVSTATATARKYGPWAVGLIALAGTPLIGRWIVGGLKNVYKFNEQQIKDFKPAPIFGSSSLDIDTSDPELPERH